ncbi:MAG: ABC transporter permease [Phycisphaerales bacterium]|nr:ABC transporter permease [Phycisphaerales bacterium]
MKLIPFTYATRNMGRAPIRLAISLSGCALVVLLVISGISFVRGMDSGLRQSASDNNVLLIGAGSEESIERSEIPQGAASEAVASIDGLRTLLGGSFASPEIHAAFPLTGKSTGDTTDDLTSHDLGVIRGITPVAFLVHPQVRIAWGRMPESGSNEVLLGATAARRLNIDPSLPSVIKIDHHPFSVVGGLRAPGTVMDGEVWMPISDLLTLAQRETISTVVLSLDQAQFDDVSAFAQQRFDLELSAVRETDYYAALAQFFRPVQVMAVISAALVGIGGLIGGLNTMYATFASRIRELGMLQVLGFSRTAIVVSIIQESLLTSMSGALFASAASILLLRHAHVEFSMGTFGLSVDTFALTCGLASGLLLGLGGAILPSIRCLRLDLPQSLKAD